jgi:nitric oxide reductase activation protein
MRIFGRREREDLEELKKFRARAEILLARLEGLLDERARLMALMVKEGPHAPCPKLEEI